MLNQTNARSAIGKVIDPVAAFLVKVGVSPDAVTIIGTIGVSAGAVFFFPKGNFAIGVLVITAFVFSDMLDGAMAREQGRNSDWGAFLDSSLDRVADGIVFTTVLVWALHTQSTPTIVAAAICVVGTSVISYIKARAQSLGLECDVGIAERTERLVILLVAAFFYGVGVPYLLPAALWVLAALILITVAQRIWHVRGQTRMPAITDRGDHAQSP